MPIELSPFTTGADGPGPAGRARLHGGRVRAEGAVAAAVPGAGGADAGPRRRSARRALRDGDDRHAVGAAQHASALGAVGRVRGVPRRRGGGDRPHVRHAVLARGSCGGHRWSWSLPGWFSRVAALAALSRLWRRLARPELRLITSPDDVFSLVLLVAWLRRRHPGGARSAARPALVAFFGLTAFFLVYVPFSKISHYIYWPFIRYYVGRHLGHRGAYPTKTVPRHA